MWVTESLSAILSSKVDNAGYFAPLATVNALIRFPLNQTVSSKLNLTAPSDPALIVVAAIYLALFLGGTYALYRRQDL